MHKRRRSLRVAIRATAFTPTKAALAVAMGIELGRWEPSKDLLKNSNGTVAEPRRRLHQELQADQSAVWAKYFSADWSRFNPENYKNDLWASFDRQAAGSAPTYTLNRLWDPGNTKLNSACTKTSGPAGKMQSKCEAYPSTCGYLFACKRF